MITAIPAFERLNSFVETFAIMRWAKLSQAVVKPPPQPAPSEPKLYVSPLPSGDLVQSTHYLSSREQSALELADLRRVTDATVSTLRAGGAPNNVLQLIGEVTVSLQDKILLEVAMEELNSVYNGHSESAPQIRTVEAKLGERKIKIDETLQKFSTKAQMFIALASPPDAVTLWTLSDNVKTAEDALAESKYALSDARFEATLLDNRVAALPRGKRKTAEQIYQKLSNARLGYLMAETDSRKRAADIKVNSARNALEKVLPPIDQGNIKVASDGATIPVAPVTKTRRS